jgi:uncharacterized damage-inducible protein DinB
MNEMERISKQLRQALDADPWYGPSLGALLDGMTAAGAAARPIADGHTIWEILLHVTVWLEEAVVRLRGLGRDLELEVEWPTMPAEATELAWRESLARLEKARDNLTAELEQIDQDRLEKPIAPGYSSVYNSLHGVIQHTIYHAGQIALLKKMG